MQTSFTEPPSSPLAICVCVHYKTPVPALGIFGLTLCQTIDAIDKCATCCHMALVFDIVHIFVYTVKKKKKKFCCTFIHNLFYCFCPFFFCNFLKNGLTLSLPAVHAKYIRGAGIAQWLEHRTRDRKVAGSNPCWSGGRIFFSRVNFLC